MSAIPQELYLLITARIEVSVVIGLAAVAVAVKILQKSTCCFTIDTLE
jgi:hypothetical protein